MVVGINRADVRRNRPGGSPTLHLWLWLLHASIVCSGMEIMCKDSVVTSIRAQDSNMIRLV